MSHLEDTELLGLNHVLLAYHHPQTRLHPIFPDGNSTSCHNPRKINIPRYHHRSPFRPRSHQPLPLCPFHPQSPVIPQIPSNRHRIQRLAPIKHDSIRQVPDRIMQHSLDDLEHHPEEFRVIEEVEQCVGSGVVDDEEAEAD